MLPQDDVIYELAKIAGALVEISKSLKKFVDEGITIYTHEDGPEAKN